MAPDHRSSGHLFSDCQLLPHGNNRPQIWSSWRAVHFKVGARFVGDVDDKHPCEVIKVSVTNLLISKVIGGRFEEGPPMWTWSTTEISSFYSSWTKISNIPRDCSTTLRKKMARIPQKLGAHFASTPCRVRAKGIQKPPLKNWIGFQ